MSRLQRGLALASLLVGVALVVPLAVLIRDSWSPLRHFDESGSHSLETGKGLWRDVVLGVTQLGAPLLLEAAAVVIALLLLRQGRRRLSAYVLLSVLGAEALSSLTKLLVDRVRPCLHEISCPATTSFPSGHAVGAAAFWGTCAVLLLPRLGRRSWWLLVIPLVVALTRVVLGVHYPSDVLAGLVMGGCWATAWTAVFAAWKDERVGREVPLEEGIG
ncbi:MAG: phosphoesterase [Frankiales bacterium]|nr:phosphoesterase [Frankiales bacterium]